MRKKFIAESKYVEREYRWRWWWPFWVYHTTHYRVVPDEFPIRASRGFTEVKRTLPPPRRPAAKRSTNVRERDRDVERSSGADFTTGLLIGTILNSGNHSSPAASPAAAPDVPDFNPGGGSYGGGGASGSWDSDSSSSSSSSDSSSSSGDSGDGSSGGD